MQRYHLVGIKGSGMSALAQMLHDLDYQIQGADIEERIFTQLPLEERGIQVYPFGAAPLSTDLTVVASNAFRDDHPELVRCREFGLQPIRYHTFLGEWMREYESFAVSGTHGKTTTTGLLAHVLHGVSPICAMIGDGTGYGRTGAKRFVFEACEYRRHFLAYKPDVAVITNIEFDHPDYFRDFEDVFEAFRQFVGGVRRRVVACVDDAAIRRLSTNVPMTTYGFSEDAEVRAVDVESVGNGTRFSLVVRGRPLGTFHIPLYGRHNVLNATAVAAVCISEGIDPDLVRSRMATFSGARRRFRIMEIAGRVLIDDYAHHPTEIRVTLRAARAKYPDRQVIAVFQPHTFSRLEAFLDEFVAALSEADVVYLCEVFGSAREGGGRVTSEDLRRRIPGSQLVTADSVGRLAEHRDAVLVFMGAGDIQKYEERLVAEIS